MTPEEKARQKIDQWFSDAGWKVSIEITMNQTVLQLL